MFAHIYGSLDTYRTALFLVLVGCSLHIATLAKGRLLGLCPPPFVNNNTHSRFISEVIFTSYLSIHIQIFLLITYLTVCIAGQRLPPDMLLPSDPKSMT